MKLVAATLLLLLALLIGAYRDAQGQTARHQDTIARLTLRVSSLESRISRDEQLNTTTALSVATITRKVSSLCFYGKVVYDVQLRTSTFAGPTVTPSYAYCY